MSHGFPNHQQLDCLFTILIEITTACCLPWRPISATCTVHHCIITKWYPTICVDSTTLTHLFFVREGRHWWTFWYMHNNEIFNLMWIWIVLHYPWCNTNHWQPWTACPDKQQGNHQSSTLLTLCEGNPQVTTRMIHEKRKYIRISDQPNLSVHCVRISPTKQTWLCHWPLKNWVIFFQNQISFYNFIPYKCNTDHQMT